MVAGATAGIGQAAALLLAKRGLTLVGIGRKNLTTYNQRNIENLFLVKETAYQ